MKKFVKSVQLVNRITKHNKMVGIKKAKLRNIMRLIDFPVFLGNLVIVFCFLFFAFVTYEEPFLGVITPVEICLFVFYSVAIVHGTAEALYEINMARIRYERRRIRRWQRRKR